MKKIILIIFASLMFANIGFAEMRVIETGKYRMRVFCIDGYKYVLFLGGGGNVLPRPALVQAFEERDGKSLPTKC